MNKRTSAATRLVAALALIGAVLIVIVVVAGAMDGDSSSPKKRTERPAKQDKREPTKKKTYTVQPGDTLTAIAHKTGVPVAEILALNPEADPQILIAGQTLKLR